MTKTIWIDVETTGLNPQYHTIIELAAVYEWNGSIIPFHRYCLPDDKPEDFSFIENLTGITWKFLEENGIKEKDLYKSFKQFLTSHIDPYDKTDKAVFSAYNADFDFKFCRSLFHRNNDKYFGAYFYKIPLDVKSTVAHALRSGLIEPQENFKNATICKYLGIEIEHAHSAMDDIKASRELQIKLEGLMQNDGKSL